MKYIYEINKKRLVVSPIICFVLFFLVGYFIYSLSLVLSFFGAVLCALSGYTYYIWWSILFKKIKEVKNAKKNNIK
jgi:hypothetical protein